MVLGTAQVRRLLPHGCRLSQQMRPLTHSPSHYPALRREWSSKRDTSHVASTSVMWPRHFLTRAEVAKRFEEFDTDGDGFLSPPEVQSAVNRLALDLNNGSVLESLWEADHDKNGLIDYYEFMSYFMGFEQEVDDTLSGEDALTFCGVSAFSSWDVLLEYCSITQGTDLMGDKTRKAYIGLIQEFKAVDLDHDGFLSIEELRTVLLQVHPEANDAQIENALDTMFERADENRDGQIDFYEFASTFRPGFIQDILVK